MIPGLFSLIFPISGRFQTITPAIKNEIASTRSPHPAPAVATITPPESVPMM